MGRSRWMRVRSASTLSKYRRLRGFTQRELALLCGRSQTTIWQLEHGRLITVTPELAEKLARWLEAPVEVLFEELSVPTVKLTGVSKKAAPRMGQGAA